MNQSNKELFQRVVCALEQPNYKWRTLTAVAKEVGVPESALIQILQRHGEEIVRSTSSSGEALYSTRKHLREKSTVVERLSRALRNRGA